MSFGSKLCEGCTALQVEIQEFRNYLSERYWQFVETYNPRAMPNYGVWPLNFFLLTTKYPFRDAPVGTSGPCIAVSIAGISQFDAEHLTWNFVSAEEDLVHLLTDKDPIGLVHLSPELKNYLEENNSFIGIPPEVIQRAIDDGHAIRVRE